jgi:outer membrane protein OmpA-like peptidoglycan-associated protein
VRKPGFIAKRIEVYVNVKGCILCVDGASTLTPGITENLTANNTMGTLITNIELDRAKLNKRIPLRNIYYDFDKWDIRPEAAEELDKVVTLLKDNPGLKVELGSHTDSRGKDDYNMTLSDKRAAAAVAYIISEGVDSTRITSKGYGESQLVNRCKNGVVCSEEEHQQNRRTELRITGVSQDSLEYLTWKSLEQIVQEEELEKANKVQKTRNRPLQEANTSVPLPPFQPDVHPEILQERGGSSKYLPQAIASNYTGYAVEIARTDEAFTVERDSNFLKLHQPMFMRREGDKYVYFINETNDLNAAREFLNKTALPKFRDARLVEFKNGEKTYLK